MVPSRQNDASTYKVSHGQGYTRYEHGSHGLRQEMTVFVPLEDPVKVIKLRAGEHDFRYAEIIRHLLCRMGAGRPP